MPKFIDPSGHTSFGIGICDRCSRKLPLDELFSDPNTPGLRVCINDLDDYDPYRLPARKTEHITMRFVRPDVPVTDIGVTFSLNKPGIWTDGIWVGWGDDTWEGMP